jgi:hypothetical protein
VSPTTLRKGKERSDGRRGQRRSGKKMKKMYFIHTEFCTNYETNMEISSDFISSRAFETMD